jgi:antitoxin (DNA-binding transcriptional repressor) of toxin-antitoxin stability system
MKTGTLRRLRREAALLDCAADGDEIMVTSFGRPYVRILSATQPRSFVGAGRRLGAKEPVTSQPVPASEWKGFQAHPSRFFGE